eukprot:335874-Rhodomonas_salina.1
MAARNGRAVDELIEVLRNGSGKAKVTSNGHRLALSVGAERAWMAGERGDGARKAVRRWRAGRGRGGRGGGSRSRPGGGSEAQADGRRARELSGGVCTGRGDGGARRTGAGAWSYAWPMRCPVLRSAVLVPGVRGAGIGTLNPRLSVVKAERRSLEALARIDNAIQALTPLCPRFAHSTSDLACCSAQTLLSVAEIPEHKAAAGACRVLAELACSVRGSSLTAAQLAHEAGAIEVVSDLLLSSAMRC